MIVEWMDRFGELATTWLWLALLATWRAFPILLLVIGIGLAFRRKLTPSVQALLLTIVLVRLMIPISIGSPMSLHQPIDRWFSGGTEEPIHQGQPKFVPRHTLLPHVDQAMVLATHAKAVVPTSPAPAPALDEILYLGLLSMVIAVSIGLLLRSIFSHIRFAMGLRSCRLLDDRPLIDLVLREGDSLGVGRRPALREVQSLAAPAVFGLFRQTICLPPRLAETLSEQELRWVIRHELAHIRRRDIPVAIIGSIAGAFHWFNPIVWILVNRLRAAMEAAADRLALQNVTQSEISAYGDLLLRFAQGSNAAKKAPTLGLISFSSGKHLKRRVESLLRDRKSNSLSAQCLSAGMVGAIALGGLTDAREVKDRPMPKIHLVGGETIPSQAAPMWFGPHDRQESGGPTFVATYDLTSILQSVPKWLQEEGDADKQTPLEQLTTLIPLHPSIKDKLHVDGTTLSAELTASDHQLLKQTLDIWRDGEPGQIAIEARFMQTNLKTAASVQWAERRIEGLVVRGLGPAIAARIDEAELSQLVRTVSADRKSNVITAPKVTLYDGQTASIADQVQRPFVTGVDPTADGRIQPVVSMVEEGLSFVLSPRAGIDNSVTLAFKVTASSIGKVSFANLPIKTMNSAEPLFTVQVPATEQCEVSSSVKLAAGESIVVAIPRVFDNKPGADAETTMIVALTPRIIDMQESSEVAAGNNP